MVTKFWSFKKTASRFQVHSNIFTRGHSNKTMISTIPGFVSVLSRPAFLPWRPDFSSDFRPSLLPCSFPSFAPDCCITCKTSQKYQHDYIDIIFIWHNIKDVYLKFLLGDIISYWGAFSLWVSPVINFANIACTRHEFCLDTIVCTIQSMKNSSYLNDG